MTTPPDNFRPQKQPDYLTEGVTFSFQFAYQALKDGHAIKRARWLGYWIIDPDDSDNVLMKCKDGTVVSMKNGCLAILTLTNVLGNDWLVLTDAEKEELDLVQSSKCLTPKAQNAQPEQPVKKTPADFGLPLPPRGWKLRFSERTPNLFQLVWDKDNSRPFSVAEATMWADFYGLTYNGKLSSDPLTYGFAIPSVSKDEVAPSHEPVTSTDDSVLPNEVPAADDADAITPDNPFGDTDAIPPADEETRCPDVVNPAKEPHDFPDPDPTGLPDGTRVTRNGNRVTVHLSENFPRNLQRTQEISAWAARYNLALIDDKSMLGRIVYAFNEEQ